MKYIQMVLVNTKYQVMQQSLYNVRMVIHSLIVF